MLTHNYFMNTTHSQLFHYTLTLISSTVSKPLDRLCISRLLELSQAQEFDRRQASVLGPERAADLSQKGNRNSGFRNEMLNGKPVIIDANFAMGSPTCGILTFDFCSDVRPDKEDLVRSREFLDALSE